MNLRKLIIRGMLVSLGLAAAAAVMAILVPGRDVIWRVVWTAAATALACALMFSADRFMERSGARAAGIFGMYLVLGEFVLVMAMIWARQLLPGPTGAAEDSLGGTIVAVGAVGIGVLMCLRLWPKPAMRVACVCGIGWGIAAFCLFLIAIWMEDSGYRKRDAMIASGGWVAAAGIVSVVSLLGFPKSRRYWQLLGVIAALAGGAMAIYLVWERRRHAPFYFTVTATVAMVVAHANASMLANLKGSQSWLRWLTIAAAIATAGLIDVTIYQDREASDLLQRLTIAAGVCAACGTIALAILSRANAKPELRHATREMLSVTIVCPRCNKKQSLRVGESECAECSLRFSIKVEEPRCPNCDYLLYGLTSDRCPECGTTIRAPERNPLQVAADK